MDAAEMCSENTQKEWDFYQTVEAMIFKGTKMRQKLARNGPEVVCKRVVTDVGRFRVPWGLGWGVNSQKISKRHSLTAIDLQRRTIFPFPVSSSKRLCPVCPVINYSWISLTVPSLPILIFWQRYLWVDVLAIDTLSKILQNNFLSARSRLELAW